MSIKVPKLFSQDLSPEWWQFSTNSNKALFDRDTDSNECKCELITDDGTFPVCSSSTDKKLDVLISAVASLTWAVKSVLSSNGSVGINKMLSKVTTYTKGHTETYIFKEVIDNIDMYANAVDVFDYRPKMVPPLVEFISDLWDTKGFRKAQRFIKRECHLDEVQSILEDLDYDIDDPDDVKTAAVMLLKDLQRNKPNAANRIKTLVVLGDAIRKHIEKIKPTNP